MYLLFALAYLCIAWHILPRIRFPTVNNISISANSSKQACHANLGADKNEEDQVHIFQYTCF